MRRLTKWIGNGTARYAVPLTNIKTIGYDQCCAQLAKYEDTGVTPEQVIEMQMDWAAMKATYPKWIPVTERLPKEDGTYLVTFSNGTRSTVGYGTCRMTVFGRPIGHGWYDLYTGSYYTDGCIIAWMPLPKPHMEGVNASNNGPKRR